MLIRNNKLGLLLILSIVSNLCFAHYREINVNSVIESGKYQIDSGIVAGFTDTTLMLLVPSEQKTKALRVPCSIARNGLPNLRLKETGQKIYVLQGFYPKGSVLLGIKAGGMVEFYDIGANCRDKTHYRIDSLSSTIFPNGPCRSVGGKKYSLCTFGFSITYARLQKYLTQRKTKPVELITRILATYVDSVLSIQISKETRVSFLDAIRLLYQEGIVDSLKNSSLVKREFTGYVITNNQYTIGSHKDVGFEVFELKNDSTLSRTWFDFVAWNTNKNAKRVAESSVVKPNTIEEWLKLKDGENLEHSAGFILIKIDKGVISRVKMLLNPPEEVVLLLYFNGMKY